jgi:(hydroxyamino)benzene mutase
MEGAVSTLCLTGVLLFLLGLLTGFGIPMFRSPRIGLSAHLDAIESGLALIAFGLLLPHLTISPGWASAIAYVLWISLYVLWLGLLAGAVYGTGRVFPIAGAGLEVRAKRWQERLSSSLISLGAVGSVVGVVALLVQWRWQG